VRNDPQSKPTRRPARRIRRFALTCIGLCIWTGCSPGFNLRTPVRIWTEGDETVLAFDADRDGRTDYWQYQRADGRKHALAYPAQTEQAPGPPVDLDQIDPAQCPHFLIVLDGIPFELVDHLWRAGHFRWFHRPSRVICCYPSMTDLALSELFGTRPCLGYQALYFDRRNNRLSDGNRVYLSGANSPWLDRMNYRCSLWWDARAYLDPQAVFDHEIRGLRRSFRSVAAGPACGYSVGTAGLATRGGQPALEACLTEIDALCEEIIYERRGRVKITLTADHGHNLTDNRRVSFEKLLTAAGYRPAGSLRGPRDVVMISYGLVTYVELFTKDPAGVAQCLVEHPDVEFVCYPEGEAIVVRDRCGQARITRGRLGFGYDSTGGDPLRLAAIADQLGGQAGLDTDDGVEDEAWFQATIEHDYPDPLRRIWRAFHGLVENPPDLIVNLRDGACHGSKFFYAVIGGHVPSTHGSLNRRNSTTFVMSMLGELPPALRSEDVLPALDRLRGSPVCPGRRRPGHAGQPGTEPHCFAAGLDFTDRSPASGSQRD